MKRYSNCLEEIHGNFVLHKGQIISERNCGVINFPKNNEVILRIFALASKMGKLKNMKAFYYVKSYIISNQHDNVPLLKFIYSEKATKFCDIFTLLLTGTTKVR